MTKAELISRVKDSAALSADESTAFFHAFLYIVTAELVAGNEIPLPGFGRFSVKARPARNGRNPRTGEPLEIPACKTTKFTAAKALKDALK
ncbi:MAG: HU family DNA-binding protein [Desulfovibrio sp.]|nr:HU family DNA-binding protein [Desulfovibrio sp.]